MITDTPVVRPDVVFVEELLDDLIVGKLRTPKFQRPFVWNPSDMLKLFDSIYKGYPIGSLLLWEASSEVESLERVGPFMVPSHNGKPATFILDGQQRLTTLLGVLRLPADHPQGPTQEEWKWWVWFDLSRREFTHVPNGAPGPSLLPLRSILRTVDFLDEARRLQSQTPDHAGEYIALAEQLAQKIKNYKVAITRIQGGKLTQAVEIFSRLNSRGRPMAPDQMLSALTYREGEIGMDLARNIDDILFSLAEYHFDNINRQMVYRAILAAASSDIHSKDYDELARRLGSQLTSRVEAAKRSLLAAANFLNITIGVPGDRFLPYSYQVVMLSEFFHRCPTPSKAQEDVLRRWFWATSLSGWFAGANTTNLDDGLGEMRALAAGEIESLQVMPLDAPARPFPLRFDARSARIRAWLIFMLTLEPRDPETGNILAGDDLLREHGSQALNHIFPNIAVPMVSNPANRMLLLRYQGRSVKDRLREMPEPLGDLVLRSHGIPPMAYEALLRDDGAAFIDLRAQHLAKLEREFMLQRGIVPPQQAVSDAVELDADDEMQSV